MSPFTFNIIVLLASLAQRALTAIRSVLSGGEKKLTGRRGPSLSSTTARPRGQDGRLSSWPLLTSSGEWPPSVSGGGVGHGRRRLVVP